MPIQTNYSQDQAMAKEIEEIVDISISLDATKVLDYVRENYKPEEVFDIDQLEDWAESNDYVRAEN